VTATGACVAPIHACAGTLSYLNPQGPAVSLQTNLVSQGEPLSSHRSRSLALPCTDLPAGQLCSTAGQCCLPCGKGTCVNPLNDVSNCGGCGAACPAASSLPNVASVTCSGGKCAVATCAPGWVRQGGCGCPDCYLGGADQVAKVLQSIQGVSLCPWPLHAQSIGRIKCFDCQGNLHNHYAPCACCVSNQPSAGMPTVTRS
jgi:hypothetical protein